MYQVCILEPVMVPADLDPETKCAVGFFKLRLGAKLGLRQGAEEGACGGISMPVVQSFRAPFSNAIQPVPQRRIREALRDPFESAPHYSRTSLAFRLPIECRAGLEKKEVLYMPTLHREVIGSSCLKDSKGKGTKGTPVTIEIPLTESAFDATALLLSGTRFDQTPENPTLARSRPPPP